VAWRDGLLWMVGRCVFWLYAASGIFASFDMDGVYFAPDTWMCCVVCSTRCVKETFGYDSDAVMKRSLSHSHVSGFHLSAKFVESCASDRYATAFCFCFAAHGLSPVALQRLRPHGPSAASRRSGTFGRMGHNGVVLQRRCSQCLRLGFWFAPSGLKLSEVAYARRTSTTRRTSSDAVPLAFLVRCRRIAPSVHGWTWTFQHGTTTLLWTKKWSATGIVCLCVHMARVATNCSVCVCVCVCACWCAVVWANSRMIRIT